MKGFLKPKLIFSFVTVLLLAGAIFGSLAGNIFRAHAQAPTVSFTKAATPTVAPGGTVDYTLTLTNTSPAGTPTLHDIHLTDLLPSGLTAITKGPTFTITPPTGGGFGDCLATAFPTVSCTVDNFAPGSVVTITFSASVSTTATGTITNTATAQSSTIGTVTAKANTTIAKPQVLFVLLQGINTSLSDKESDANTHLGKIPDFYKTVRAGRGGHIHIPGIVPFLQSNGYKDAQFLSYSYAGSDKSTGHPEQYPCLITFTQHISKDANLLGQQINATLTNNPALKGKPTDVYIIAHSLGGAVAYAYLTALLKAPTVVPTLPSNASLKGVITLDSPIGGVSSNPDFEHGIFDKVFKEVKNKKGEVVGGCKGLTKFDQMVSVFDLANLFDTTSKPTFPPPDDGKPNDNQGAHASDLKLLGGNALTNQELAEIAAMQGTSVLTIGNNNDFLYNPSACHLLGAPHVNFKTSQWIEDEAGADDPGDIPGVYARQFTAGTGFCEISTLFGVNHFEVYNNTAVENGLMQFLAGGVPDALNPAPPNP